MCFLFIKRSQIHRIEMNLTAFFHYYITWSMQLLTRTVSYPALRRCSSLQLRLGARCVPSLDITGISAFHTHAYSCSKESKWLTRIYSQAIIYSFGDKAAQAGAWISRRSPKLKRERQQLVAGTNEAFAEFVRSSTFFSITPGWIRLNRRVEEKRITAAANLFA